MGYERYPRSTTPQGDYYGRRDPRDDPRGQGRGDGYQDTRGYRSGSDDGQRGGPYGDRGYGARDQGRQDYGRGDQGGYGGGDRGGYAPLPQYHGSYASDGHRFEDVGRYAHADDDSYRQGRQSLGRRPDGQPQGGYGEERGFFQRAGDEVRSWFGDEEAERRRDRDQRYDEQHEGDRVSAHRDHDYHSWRSGQIAALDRDYDEYRQEHRAKFENEFASWRTSRQGQRDSLSRVGEHMDVVGSDGEHVGTVDKVRGDRILLTKNDVDAGGRHHSIPSRWVESVEGKVTLNKTAAEAKQQWQDEERNSAMFNYGDNAGADRNAGAQASSRSTSGAKTY